MNGLARVYLFTVLVTAGGICAPFFLYAGAVAEALASPAQPTILTIRLLAVAWAGLCVGYAFAFGAALRGERRPGMLWAGIAANGGTCFLLGATIVTGAWEPWDASVRWILLAAAILTAAITGALLWYGLLFDRVFAGRQAPAPAIAPAPPAQAAPASSTAAPAAPPPAPAAQAPASEPPAAAAADVQKQKVGGGLLGRLRRKKPEASAGEKKT